MSCLMHNRDTFSSVLQEVGSHIKQEDHSPEYLEVQVNNESKYQIDYLTLSQTSPGFYVSAVQVF